MLAIIFLNGAGNYFLNGASNDFLNGASNDGQEMLNNYPQVKCRLILISARGE